MNPFKYNTIVSGQDFCGRQNLLNNDIIPLLDSLNRVVLLGEKNIGKSSTAYEAVRRYKGAKHLYVDLLGIKSIDSLYERIKRSVILMEQKSPFYQKLTRSFPHKFSISFDEPLIQMQSNLILEVLASIIKSQYKKSRFVVIFDEFQDILNLQDAHQALAILCAAIRSQDHIPYIFVGSMPHKMEKIFSDNTSPFYRMAVQVPIGPISFDEFSKFLKNKFSKGNRKIDNTVLRKVFEMSDDIPGYIQQFCESLWEVTSDKKIISLNKLKSALELILAREQTFYENYCKSLTNIQLRCLNAIVKKGGSCVSSAAIMKSAESKNISIARRAISQMVDFNILVKTKDEYKFANPFFRAWFLKKYEEY